MTPIPGLTAPPLPGAARPGLCTDCGVSRIGDGRACGQACQFIQPDYPGLESRSHGRAADPDRGEEAFFGVAQKMLRARLTQPAPGAQWTGITTTLAARLLETGAVDAVLTVAPDPHDRWKPLPVIVTDPAAMAAVLIAGERSRWWRPTGLSGWVTNANGRGPCSSRYRNAGRAMSPVAMNASRMLL